jgi:hypothetical protein
MLNQDFKEFIELLNLHNVRYLVVGGYAVAVHGHPRYTKDLDVWIWVTEQNAHNLVNALSEFGFSSLELSVDDFLERGYVIQLGQPPNRIDILTQVDGLEFENCYPAKVILEIDGVTVDFIDLENLKKNKQASGRLQDLADLENLQ